jgi:hypothetical protein
MFKKFFTTLMVAALFSVQAGATTNSGLKAAFDELNYSLNVEWDQKDQSVYENNMKKFTSSLRDLQAKGLTDADLIDFVKSEVKDARVARDLQTAFTMISIQKMSKEDASKYMVETMKKTYSSGASWNGDANAGLYIGLSVLIIGVAVALAATGHIRGGNGGSVCTGGSYCTTSCYDDYYYGYTCYDTCSNSCY